VDITHVIHAAEPFQSRLFVEQGVDTLQVHPFVLLQEKMQGRVDVPGARSHYQPFQRRQAKRSIDTDPASDSGHRAAIAEMNGD